MDFDNRNSNCEAGELERKGGSQRICVSDHVNGVQHSDSFVVDVERFSQLIERNINGNSRITRNVSRKVSVTDGEKKISPLPTNQRDASAPATSPIATLHGGGRPEKPMVAALGTAGHSSSPKHQHQIKNGGLSSSVAEIIHGGKRNGFRHSPSTWSIGPKGMLIFFATLSSLGTILLIYFTLSIGNLNKADNDLDITTIIIP